MSTHSAIMLRSVQLRLPTGSTTFSTGSLRLHFAAFNNLYGNPLLPAIIASWF
jgi:hypothetical protein